MSDTSDTSRRYSFGDSPDGLREIGDRAMVAQADADLARASPVSLRPGRSRRNARSKS